MLCTLARHRSFAVFMTMIATDWVMSLEETFSSSMFPVIMFDNAAVSAYAVGLLVLLHLKRRGDPRFARLTFDLRDGRVVISGTAADPTVAWELARKIAPLVGDRDVVVSIGRR